MPDVITCISEGDDPSGRRRPGVNRSDDAPARPAQGCEPGATARATRPLVATGKPVCEPHDFTGEPGAGNRHAGFGERGEETCPWGPDCGPVRKRRISHRPPTGYAPPLDSTARAVRARGLVAAVRAVSPVDDLGLLDLEAVIVVGGETRRLTDGAVDVDHDATGAADEVMVIVTDSILVSRGRPRGLNPAGQAPVDQRSQGVVYRLPGNRSDAPSHIVGQLVGSGMRVGRHCP